MKYLVACFAFFLFTACNKDEPAKPKTGELEYMVFGHFYGYCVGEGCIEIFKFDADDLYEDTLDNYPWGNTPYEGDYIPLSQEKFDIAKNLIDFFPDELYTESDTILGIPDGGDWGGIYVEVKHVNDPDRSGFWLLDQMVSNMPDAYHAFVQVVNQKIDSIQ